MPRTLPKMLFISPRFLFPMDSGGQIRTGQILRHLNNRHFDVALLCLATPEQISRYANELTQVCNNFIEFSANQGKNILRKLKRAASIFDKLPVSVASDLSSELKQMIATERHKDYKVVVYDFIHSAVNFVDPGTAKTVVFTHNVEQEIYKRHVDVNESSWRRMVWKSQHLKMKRFEDGALQLFDRVIVVSEKDGIYFKKIHPHIDIRIIPTGVDLELFRYAPANGSREIVFTGSMDYSSNIEGVAWFLQEVWGVVKKKHADAKLKIIGRNPPSSLVSRFSRDKDVRFTGWVENVYEASKTGGVYIVPLRVGSGTRIKVFEAMAMGIPLVSTSIGVEGLPVNHKEHYLNADSAESFVEAIDRLWGDKRLRQQLSQNARQFVEKNFGWERVAATFAESCYF